MIDGSGIGHDVDDIDDVSIWTDTNNDGVGEIELAQIAFDADNGEAALSGFSEMFDGPNNESKNYLIIYTFTGDYSFDLSFTPQIDDTAAFGTSIKCRLISGAFACKSFCSSTGSRNAPS